VNGIRQALDRVLAVACVALFAILVLTVSWQVFTRQVLGDPSTWSEELARYVFVWLGLFAAALVFSERGHIAVDFVVQKLSPRVQRSIAIVVQLAIIGFALVVLVWGGLVASVAAWDHNLTGLPTQIGPMYLAMPITGAIISFYAIYHSLAILRSEETAVEAGDKSTGI